MGTPYFVKFSRIEGSVRAAIERLDIGVNHQLGLEYDRFAGLQPDDYEFSAGFELAHELVPCRSQTEALSLGAHWNNWVVSYLADHPQCHVNFCLFDIRQDSFAATMSFDSFLVSYEPPGLPAGGWLRQLLLGIVAAFRCDVCGYGQDNAYCIRYETLDAQKMVERVRRGELFEMAYPILHAISTRLVKPEEMNELLGRLPCSEFLKYQLTTTGYHILSQLL